MTALADALTAAQSRAVAALGKQYVGGTMDEDAVRIALDSIGLQDPADTNRWLAALTILRETGAAVPTGNGATAEPEPASNAQLQLIEKLCREKNIEHRPDLPLTKADAHEIIDTIKAGTYDPSKWRVPF